MEIVLALCAAAVYGVADYSGGRASRTVSPIVVTAIGQGCGLLFLVVIVAQKILLLSQAQLITPDYAPFGR